MHIIGFRRVIFVKDFLFNPSKEIALISDAVDQLGLEYTKAFFGMWSQVC